METSLLSGEKADPLFAGRYPLRILIAEDNYINRRLLLFMLASLGYRADARENGQDCYEAALKNHYDLLLTDIDMPEMSGIEVALALRSAGADLPIIAVTASAPETARAECFEAGMADFLHKPISLASLKRCLREVALRKWLNEANHAVVSRP